MGYQILVSLGKEKIVLYSTIIAAIVNILLNMILIGPLSHIGAAIASVVSEAAVSLYQLHYVSKCIPLKGNTKTAQSIIIPSIAMLIVMIPFLFLHLDTYIELFIVSTLGLLTYIIVGIKLHNETVSIVLNKIGLKL